MLSVRGVCKTLPGFAIKGVSLEVGEGQYFVLLGRTGVGKSVLLETIAGLIHPDAGRIFLDGRDITDEKIQKRGIGMVFQSSTLFPHMTVYDNIAYPLRVRYSNHQIRERVVKLAKEFEVSGLLRARPRRLSGGETQRVSLARAVASEPRCLLLDEPLSSLDVESRAQMRALLRRIGSDGKIIVHVTHDYREAVSLGSHIAVMEGGRIAQVGRAADVFQRPKCEFIARFVGIRNFFKGRLEDAGDYPANTKRFITGGLSFSVLSDRPAGSGYIMVRSEDVTVSAMESQTSTRNTFEGTIRDIVPAPVGVEVIVDIGLGKPKEIAALVTVESVRGLELRCGRRVWVSFKASAVKFIEA